MKLKVIATGSKGNSYLFSASGEHLLIDAGAHKAEVMKATNYETANIAAILLTHEHGDHAAHVKEWELSGRPLILSKGTNEALRPSGWIVEAKAGKLLKVGTNYSVLPYNVIHDAAEPFGYMLKAGETKVLFATDTAAIPQAKEVTSFIVECNWDGDSLSKSDDPQSLKERVMNTHMGLSRLKDYFRAADLTKARKIILIHASGRNLNKEKAVSEIQQLTGIPTYMAFNGFEIDLV